MHHHLSTIPRAFLSSLRTNLQISFEDLSASSSSRQPPSASEDYSNDASSSAGFADDLEDPPSPTDTSTTSTTQQSFPLPATWTYHASTDGDRRAALRLVADSIREQRVNAIRSILLHPAVLAAAFSLLTLFVRCALHGQEQKKKGAVACLLATAGLTAAAVIVAYRTTRHYLTMASAVEDTAWLREGLVQQQQQQQQRNNHHPNSHGPAGSSKHHSHHNSGTSEDELLITRDHEEIVAALVLRTARTNALTSGAPSANGMRALRHRHSNSSTTGRLTGVIRAWTVKKSHRNHGLGLGLLESAVAICRVRRLDGPIFADDERFCGAHVVSPGYYWWWSWCWWHFGHARSAEKAELKAKECLRAVIEGKQ
ncbi:hypothetical protein UA08_08425 [Talaromyces atroroseus]|uniref:Uncharacterized protein n=1 Tax=Talaromyces atroroseus TaxID=1441469 RepID=A0A1Q5Q835_TALAT|nr:hypothetical protein UA08_08425 [Talaromyces atroroseus]OKL56212.1 hypothetical protein UA08_08425 [Talaromyces atroroseus]